MMVKQVPEDVQQQVDIIKAALAALGKINAGSGDRWGVKIVKSCNPTQVVDVEPPVDGVDPSERD